MKVRLYVRPALRGLAVASALLAVGAAQAATLGSASAPIDYSQFTNSVDFGSTVTAIMAISASSAALYLAIRGSKAVLRAIGGR